MRHSTILGAAVASLLLSTSTYAFEPITSGDDGVAGVEWVRQTLESGFNGTEVRTAGWSDTSGQSQTFALSSLEGSNSRTTQSTSVSSATGYDAREAGLTSRPTAPTVAGGTSVEEVVVLGVRRREPQWHPPIVEEPENDWRGRDQAVRADIGRIEVGRAVIYQDLSDRRRYDAFRDEYNDPRPQNSVTVGLGKR